MPITKKRFSFVVLFWIVCFVVGYIFSPQINALVLNRKSVEVTAVVSAKSGTGEESDPFVESIDPTSLEAMMIETYASEASSATETGKPFLIAYSQRDYYSCEKFDPGAKNEISDPDNLLAFVNKWYKISYEYTPPDLVQLSSYGIRTNGNISVRKEAADKFNEIYIELKKQGLNVAVSSGWRSFGHQQRLLNNWTQMVGAKNANNYAAIPGYSEHHLGTVVDMLTPENGYSISPSYFNTRTFKWMSENAHKYGFVLSYPQGKTQITGYNPEGWHWRYVGVDTATEIHNQGITSTEYFFKLHNICL